jgi:hypothetical protein
MTAAVAVALVELAPVIEASIEAYKILQDAKPILDTYRAQAAQGATFEQIATSIRALTVTAETDAQAAVDKLPAA